MHLQLFLCAMRPSAVGERERFDWWIWKLKVFFLCLKQAPLIAWESKFVELNSSCVCSPKRFFLIFKENSLRWKFSPSSRFNFQMLMEVSRKTEPEKNYFYSPSGALLCFDKFLWLSLVVRYHTFDPHSTSPSPRKLGSATHTKTSWAFSVEEKKIFHTQNLTAQKDFAAEKGAKLWQSHLLLFFTMEARLAFTSVDVDWKWQHHHSLRCDAKKAAAAHPRTPDWNAIFCLLIFFQHYPASLPPPSLPLTHLFISGRW